MCWNKILPRIIVFTKVVCYMIVPWISFSTIIKINGFSNFPFVVIAPFGFSFAMNLVFSLPWCSAQSNHGSHLLVFWTICIGLDCSSSSIPESATDVSLLVARPVHDDDLTTMVRSERKRKSGRGSEMIDRWAPAGRPLAVSLGFIIFNPFSSPPCRTKSNISSDDLDCHRWHPGNAQVQPLPERFSTAYNCFRYASYFY